MNREDLISRIMNFLSSLPDDARDASQSFTVDVARWVDELRAIAADDDIDAWKVIRLFHWLRYLTLPEGEDQPEAWAAVDAFSHVLPIAPHLVPEPIQGLLRQLSLQQGNLDHDDLDAAGMHDKALEMLRDPSLSRSSWTRRRA